MRWPKFLNKSVSSNDVKQEFPLYESESFGEGSIDVSSQPSEAAICLRPNDHPGEISNASYPQHYYSLNFSGAATKNTSPVVYVPSSLQIGYSVVPTSDYVQQMIRQKDSEIVKLIDESESIKEQLQMYRLKYTETERINHELQIRLSRLSNNNNRMFVLDELSKSFANESKLNANTEFFSGVESSNQLNVCKDSYVTSNFQNENNFCRESGDNATVNKQRNVISTSTPLTNAKDENNEQQKNNFNELFTDITVTPIGKMVPIEDTCFEEQCVKNIAKLDAVLKKYELNISASLRILKNLVEHKNPSPDDLFTSFFDLEWSNNSDDVTSNNQAPNKILQKILNMRSLSVHERQKVLNDELTDMCKRAQEGLHQWDNFHQQLLICIGTDVIKASSDINAENSHLNNSVAGISNDRLGSLSLPFLSKLGFDGTTRN